jgi:hypothetical protein
VRGDDKYTFPNLTNAPTALICVPIPIIPFFRQFFGEMQQRYIWQTRADWLNAYQVFAEIEEDLMGSCVQQLIEGQNRLYRLLDTSLNGVAYTATTDPDTQITTITPDQPVVPTNEVGTAPGLRRQLLDMQGTIGGGWFNFGSRPATLADLADSMKGSTDGNKTQIQNLLDALSAGANAITIFDAVKGLFMDGEEIIADGAVLGTLIGTAIANAAMLGTMSGQIDRLVASLDGGGLTGPGDNVLTALRGTTEASATRNVIDSSSPLARLEAIENNTGRLAAIENNTGRLATIENQTLSLSSDNALLLSMLTNVRDLMV